MGRGDFSRPDLGRLKPPLPQTNAPKTSFITYAKLNSCHASEPCAEPDTVLVQHIIPSSPLVTPRPKFGQNGPPQALLCRQRASQILFLAL